MIGNKFWITLVAVVGYGAWAFYSSVYDGTMDKHFNVAIRAALIQGTYSGVLTLINLSVLEFLFLKLNSLLLFCPQNHPFINVQKNYICRIIFLI